VEVVIEAALLIEPFPPLSDFCVPPEERKRIGISVR